MWIEIYSNFSYPSSAALAKEEEGADDDEKKEKLKPWRHLSLTSLWGRGKAIEAKECNVKLLCRDFLTDTRFVIESSCSCSSFSAIFSLPLLSFSLHWQTLLIIMTPFAQPTVKLRYPPLPGACGAPLFFFVVSSQCLLISWYYG